MRDLYSNDVETAAALARHDAMPDDDRPSPSEYDDRTMQSCIDVPVTLADFAPRIPVPDGTDDDMPF